MRSNSIEHYIGKKFNSLTVISIDYGTGGNGKHYYANCQCDCGKVKKIRSDTLKGNVTKSCTCQRKYLNSEANKTHGKSYTNTYASYKGMLDRCYNPKNNKYRFYGNRGIRVCDRWIGNYFLNFYADMGGCPKHFSLERINVDGDYEPSNCKWIHKNEQSKNRTICIINRRKNNGVLN